MGAQLLWQVAQEQGMGREKGDGGKVCSALVTLESPETERCSGRLLSHETSRCYISTRSSNAAAVLLGVFVLLLSTTKQPTYQPTKLNYLKIKIHLLKTSVFSFVCLNHFVAKTDVWDCCSQGTSEANHL